MIWKKIENTKWRRVFVFWPKGTMDGFKVSLSCVWKRTIPIEDDHGLSLDSYVVDEYHTNPDGLEDEYQKNKKSVTQIQIGGKNSKNFQSMSDLNIEIPPLTEGKHVTDQNDQ